MFFFTRNRRLPSGNNPLRLRLFFMLNRETLPRDSPPRLRNRFPTRLQKSLEGVGEVWRGRENLSPERFPRPLQTSAFLQNVKDARIKPVALVGGEGLKTDFEVAGINRGAVHGFNFIDGEFPLVP